MLLDVRRQARSDQDAFVVRVVERSKTVALDTANASSSASIETQVAAEQRGFGSMSAAVFSRSAADDELGELEFWGVCHFMFPSVNASCSCGDARSVSCGPRQPGS
jgi:hypothetical protein